MQERPDAADWSVVYPHACSADAVWRILQSMRLVNWSWDIFIWDLRELLRLLTKAPAEFNYLFLTAFVRARAAYLAAHGPFDCTQQDILTGLGSKRVQFVSIYYRLLLAMLLDVLGSEDGDKLIGDREERLFQLAMVDVERRYLEILQVIALAPDMDAEIHGLDVESWATGTEVQNGRRVCVLPAPVEVRVFIQRYGRHKLVRPNNGDLVKKIMKREPMRSFLQRGGEVNQTDTEFEKLSRFAKLGGYQVVKYGDLEVQYYVTVTNARRRRCMWCARTGRCGSISATACRRGRGRRRLNGQISPRPKKTCTW